MATLATNNNEHDTNGFALLEHEDPKEYAALLADLVAEHRPATPTERFLVNEIAQAQWRLARIQRIEHRILDSGLNSNADEALAGAFIQNQQALMRLDRYMASIRRAWRQAMDQLRKLRAAGNAVTRTSTETEKRIDKTKPMPPDLQRELDHHRRRDPLFDHRRDASQMSRELRRWFARAA
jgi:exonuclease VII large subunit